MKLCKRASKGADGRRGGAHSPTAMDEVVRTRAPCVLPENADMDETSPATGGKEAYMAIETVRFESRHGTEYLLAFERARYANGAGIAIETWCADPGPSDPDEMEWEPYGSLTVNLATPAPEGMAYLDSNNLPDLVGFVLERGWATLAGTGTSGYCEYPLARFSEEFLEEICFEGRRD